MTMQRLSIKFYFEDPGFDIAPGIPLFHAWIRKQYFDDLLVDVVDYRHVHHGLGILVVGHENDFALDQGEGRPGLLFTVKNRAEHPRNFLDMLNYGLAQAILVRDKLVEEMGAKFVDKELRVQVADRLRAPNTDETFAALRSDLESGFANSLSTATFEREGSGRDPFRVRARL
jgi:hypothetical protein